MDCRIENLHLIPKPNTPNWTKSSPDEWSGKCTHPECRTPRTSYSRSPLSSTSSDSGSLSTNSLSASTLSTTIVHSNANASLPLFDDLFKRSDSTSGQNQATVMVANSIANSMSSSQAVDNEHINYSGSNGNVGVDQNVYRNAILQVPIDAYSEVCFPLNFRLIFVLHPFRFILLR